MIDDQGSLFAEAAPEALSERDFIAEAIADPRTLFVANHSGGKDSQAQLLKLKDLVPRERILVIHATLGEMEWPGALEFARDQAQRYGMEFRVAQAAKTLLEMVARRFESRPEVPSWPSASTRQCTSDLKRSPIAREVRQYTREKGFCRVVNCLGLRAEESSGRAKRPTLSKVDRNTSGRLAWFEWLPIHGMKTKEVFDSIAAAGEKPHYAYALGNERLSCVFCIMGSKNDLCNGARQHPQLLERYREMEARTGYTMHMSRKPLIDLVAEVPRKEPTASSAPVLPIEAAVAHVVQPASNDDDNCEFEGIEERRRARP